MAHTALDDLRAIQVSDLESFGHAVEAGQQLGWAYCLPYLMTRIRRSKSDILLGEDEGSICVYTRRERDYRTRLDLVLAPTPMRAPVLARCLERMNDFNGDRSARVLRIDEKDADSAASVPGLKVRPRNQQYLLAPESYASLGGKSFRTLRRQVACVEALSGVEVAEFSPIHREGAHRLLNEWSVAHRAVHETRGGVGSSRRAIDLTADFSGRKLFGEVVLLNGRLIAYALAGEIRSGVACFLEAKSDPQVHGLGYFHRYSFLRKQSAFQVFNDGSDTGRTGLGQLKRSLRPIGMHVEFRGTQER